MDACHASTIDALKDVAEDTLVRLVYVSRISLTSRADVTIFDDIEDQASSHNASQNITGILCYGNGHFLQCIEGTKDKILALQKRIFEDKRHKLFKVLIAKPIAERSFTDWRMRSLFLERWLWSPATKAQAVQLSPFLPFRPHEWHEAHTSQFLNVVQSLHNPPHVRAAGVTYNAFGNMLQHVAAPHQAFLLVQAILGVLTLIAVAWMFA
ncbi:BLUF domain-containing protein [Psychrobacter aestuarii]|uniref:BLUF domain-containing protein n=1 Tax=Psychrobacter aestuarii TaxID=556327 RepID=A0ABN0VKY3_9GAMM|nr:BLUF domain-containing protein [Psychrobacter aestuarii]